MNDNIINIYNSCAVITVLHKIGLTYEQISGAFDRLKIVATRYDRTTVGDVSITMQFAKGQNPSACGRAFSYVAGHSGERKSVLIMTDFQERDESESVCWLYDSDMSPLADPTINEIVFAGPRCRDQKLRAIMAGVPEDKIKITDTPADGVDLIDVKNHSEIFILYQLYTIPAAARAKRRLIERVEAEK
jgi:UDP-N-acetylmuramyl pentapeptide synthase